MDSGLAVSRRPGMTLSESFDRRKERATEAEAKLKRLYDAIENGIADVSDPMLKHVLECPVLYRSGAPEEIRTPDPQIRSLVLYPAELRARFSLAFQGIGPEVPHAFCENF
jgi:hypothetical protein